MNRFGLALAATVTALVLALGVAACGDDDDEAGGGGGGQLDLTIGNLVPLTGDLAPYGPAGEKAGDLALQQIEAAIKATGADQTVELVTEDGASDDQGGVQAARKLIADGATCISGDYASTATVSVARSVTIPEGVMLISPASTADALSDLEDDGLFARTAPPDGLQGKALADRMDQELGGLQGKTINIGARNDLYGTGFADSLEAELEERGATVAEKVVYDPEQPSYNSEAAQLTSGNPDNFVIIDFPETFAKLGPALARTGNWEPSQTFITDGLSSTDLTELLGAEATEGMLGTAPGTFCRRSPRRVRRALHESAGAGPQPLRRDHLRRCDPLLPGRGRGWVQRRRRDRRGDRRRHRSRRRRSTPSSSCRRRSKRSKAARTSTTKALRGRSTGTRTVTSAATSTTSPNSKAANWRKSTRSR